MNIYEQLLNERNQLEDIIHKSSEFLSLSPENSLKVQCRGRCFQYYLNQRGAKSQSLYLNKKKQEELIKNLAIKKYCLKILKVASMQQEAIDKFLSKYQENAIDDVFNQMSPGVKCLIEPFEIERKDYCKCTSEATTETAERSPEVDLARNLLSICEAFLKAKGCRP